MGLGKHQKKDGEMKGTGWKSVFLEDYFRCGETPKHYYNNTDKQAINDCFKKGLWGLDAGGINGVAGLGRKPKNE